MTEAARPLSEVDRQGTPDRFGYEWGTYSEILPEYEQQFTRWTIGLSKEDWAGKTFLDVGCGMGRNSFWPMTYGAKGGFAIDLDDTSLEQARRNLNPYPNLTVKKMSAYDIDIVDAVDIAFSIGVIHHLKDPAAALSKMVQATVPGGKVLIWVYGFENNEWIVKFFDPLRKLLFSKMPIGLVHALSVIPAGLLWLLLRVGFGKIEYLKLISNFSFRHLRSIVFDQMLPSIANYWSRDEVEQLMRDAGLVDIKLHWVNEMSWTAIGQKPLP